MLGDPFNYRNYNYEEAKSKLLADKDSLMKYNNGFIQMLGNVEDPQYKQSFIDYEMWSRYVYKYPISSKENHK